MSDGDLDCYIDTCTQLMDEVVDAPWIEQQAAAEDATAALAYALRCRKTGKAQEAAWAARRAYDALDDYVINREGIDTNAPDGDIRVLAHPLIQAEFERQNRDFEEL